jgi:AcrR family transcriptional regulator
MNSPSPCPPEPLRHLPQQARSRQRFNQILEAAAEIFDEVGYEAATTEAIAIRANTSIGSLYRFFTDKSAILYALAEKYTEQMQELFAEVFSPDAVHLPLAVVISQSVDAFEHFYLTQPGYRVVFAQTQFSPELQAIDKRLDYEIALKLNEFFALRQPQLEPARRKLVTLVSVKAASSLQLFSFSEDEAFRQQVVAETKNLLIGYLQPFFPDPDTE